jgi:hypothetical protein
VPEYNVETNKAVYLLANSLLSQRRSSSARIGSMQLHES